MVWCAYVKNIIVCMNVCVIAQLGIKNILN